MRYDVHWIDIPHTAISSHTNERDALDDAYAIAVETCGDRWLARSWMAENLVIIIKFWD